MIQYSISEIEKNSVRVDQILILGLKSGARSQQLLLLRLRQVKTAELLNLAKSSRNRPRVCRINLQKKGAATRVRS